MKLSFRLLLFIFFGTISHVNAQTDTLPYLKDKNLPSFIFLNLDSTEFNTFYIPEGKKTLMIYFIPDCEHCQMLTEELIANLDSLKPCGIYMISPLEMNVTKDFDKKYGVSQHQQMHIYRDAQHIFTSYYGVHFFPYIAIYNEKKKLMRTFEGTMKMNELIAIVNERE